MKSDRCVQATIPSAVRLQKGSAPLGIVLDFIRRGESVAIDLVGNIGRRATPSLRESSPMQLPSTPYEHADRPAWSPWTHDRATTRSPNSPHRPGAAPSLPCVAARGARCASVATRHIGYER